MCTTHCVCFHFQEGPSKSSRGLTVTEQQKSLRTNSATRYNTTNKHPNHTLLTKSQSVDDVRKKTQALADEKKKKRDDKLRQAQIQREAQEKERMEKHRKQVQVKKRSNEYSRARLLLCIK